MITKNSNFWTKKKKNPKSPKIIKNILILIINHELEQSRVEENEIGVDRRWRCRKDYFY